MTITLGEEQEQAYEMVINFIKNKTAPACVYYGSAGTGKTLIVNYIIEWCEKNSIPYTLCAPTHKAALVLSKYTDRDAITLHKLLALSPNLDIFALDFNNLMFKMGMNKSGDMPYKGVVICDECSMINDDLLEVLTKKCSEYESLLCFCGDIKQLQPVKQDYITKVFNIHPQVELTKIYRQSSENGLIPCLQALRSHSISRFDQSIGSDGSLLVTSNMKEFLGSARDQFKSAISNSDILKTKIICYTNDRVKAYNNALHKILFGDDCVYHKGEFLIGNENLEFNKFKFYNSMDYIIISDPVETDLHIPNFGVLPAWRIELYDSLSKYSENVSILSEDISKDYIESLTCKIEDLRQQAVSLKSINKTKSGFYWKQYFATINSFTTPIDLYYDGRLVRKKSFDYSYAITAHKAQGSTLDNILIDMRNINSCFDESIKRQLQYVALSRTKHNALIYQ